VPRVRSVRFEICGESPNIKRCVTLVDSDRVNREVVGSISGLENRRIIFVLEDNIESLNKLRKKPSTE